jgi:Right handed beta helix region
MGPRRHISRGLVAVAVIALLFGAYTASDSARTRVRAPHSIARPAIKGATAQGKLLRATRGRWSGRPTHWSFQWRRCNHAGRRCRNIRRATRRTYRVSKSDIGHRLRVQIRARNGAGSTLAVSAATHVVTRAIKHRVPPPGNPTPPTTPPPPSAPAVVCSATFSSLASAVAAMKSAGTQTTVCLTSGSYGAASVSVQRSTDATLAAAPGAHVTLGAVSLSGSHIGLENVWIQGEIDLHAGASFITLSHDDITGGGEGVVFDTSDCTVPNAPTWSGCQPQPKVTDVTMAGNHFHDIGLTSGEEDAIHLDNWARVRVSGNEFDHIIESGNHTDCLQSVYGGTDLVFDHNYEHDNDCQGFFIKDGDATNVSVLDNLFVRDSYQTNYGNFAQIWNTAGLTVEHNTIWDGKGLGFTADSASVSPSALVDHNVISEVSVTNSGGTPYAFTESNNMLGDSVKGFPMGSGDSSGAHPGFINSGGNDYRLASNPRGIGIDWRPSDQSYGPPA